MKVTIWHNPRCSKSRAALKLLREKGVEVEVRKYLECAPTEAEIVAVLEKLALPAIALTRVGEAIFRDLGLSRDDDAQVLVHAMAQNPILIQRPVVIREASAVIGRPLEAVLDLLN